MKVFLFIILFCVALTVQARPSSTNPKLPNSEYIGYSYDVRVGQPIQQALRQPVIQLTWSQRNTIYINGTNYLIPLESTVISDPGFDQESYTDLFQEEYQSEQQLSITLSFKIGSRWCLPGMFKESTQITFFSSQSQTYDNFTAFTNLRVKSYSQELLPQQFNLTKNFITDRALLPKVYNATTCPQWKEFIKIYGTNVTTAALQGGVVQMTTSFSKSLLNFFTEEEITEQISYQFTLLKTTGTLSATQQQDLTILNQRYISKIQLVGGIPGAFTNASDWESWANTVFNNPDAIQIDLLPMSKFMIDAEQEQGCNMACAAYFASSIENQWIYKQAMPANDYMISSSASTDDYVYAIGVNLPTVNEVLQYSPQNNRWTSIPNIPTARTEYSTVSLNNSFYVIGGVIYSASNYYAVNNVERFDSTYQEWYTSAPLNYARFNAYTFAYNNSIYVVGGCYYTPGDVWATCDSNGTDILPTEIYDPVTNTWTINYDIFPQGSVYAYNDEAMSGIFVKDNKVYVVLVSAWGSNDPYIQIYFYCGNNNNFIMCGQTSYGPGYLEYNSMTAILDNEIYVMGGCNENVYQTYNNVYSYNIQTGVWTIRPPMNTARCSGGAGTVQGRIYVFGGIKWVGDTAAGLNTVEQYTPPFPIPYC